MNALQKLTKKQQKGVAFRHRKSGKQRTIAYGLTEMDANAVPVMEDQDLAVMQSDSMEVEGNNDQKKGESSRKKGDEPGTEKHKGKDPAGPEEVGVDKKGKKRKREEIEKEKVDKKKKEHAKQRFILFLGNLKYTTTKEAIQGHFALCDPPPTVRLLTPKPKPGVAVKPKSKGCAFLEFTHRNALQQALKQHQSMLDGRMINVELTSGGGGKGESRLQKVRERNKALSIQRKDHLEKDSSSLKGTVVPTLPDKPQRYSTTSGIDQVPAMKRTWTVGDVVEDQTHRGGKRHAKSSKGSMKHWGTGVNAIPVG